jgi:hypothetical protein
VPLSNYLFHLTAASFLVYPASYSLSTERSHVYWGTLLGCFHGLRRQWDMGAAAFEGFLSCLSSGASASTHPQVLAALIFREVSLMLQNSPNHGIVAGPD